MISGQAAKEGLGDFAVKEMALNQSGMEMVGNQAPRDRVRNQASKDRVGGKLDKERITVTGDSRRAFDKLANIKERDKEKIADIGDDQSVFIERLHRPGHEQTEGTRRAAGTATIRRTATTRPPRPNIPERIFEDRGNKEGSSGDQR